MHTDSNRIFTKAEINALRNRNDVAEVTRRLQEIGIKITKQAVSKWLLNEKATSAVSAEIQAVFSDLFIEREAVTQARINALRTARQKAKTLLLEKQRAQL